MTELDPLVAAACDAYQEAIRAERAVAAELKALEVLTAGQRDLAVTRQLLGEARRRREEAWDAYEAAIAAVEKERQ